MNRDDFVSSQAGSVVQVGRGSTAYWAFIPHPLPPDLAPDWELSRQLSAADRSLSELAGLGRSLPNPNLFVAPPVDAMRTALDAFEKYLHQSADIYPPLVRLAFIHYQFEAIHPFVDGNGRIGRLLLSLLLVNWNLLPLPLLYLSAYFERNRQAYYDHLLAVSQRGGWREWISFFLNGVQLQAQDTIWRIKKLQDLQMTWREQLSASRASANDFKLLDYLSETPIVTISQVQKLLQVNSYNTAKRSVERLIDLHVLFPLEGVEYDRHFYARDILLTLAEDQFFQ